MEKEPESCFSPGDTVPGHEWQVVAYLGAGGMGEVYEVRDPVLDRRYVLKTVKRDLRDDPGIRRQFLSEAKALARVKHRNIVNIVAYGTTRDAHAQPFFLMEKAHGSALHVALVAVGKLSVRLACDVFHPLALALHHIHEKGLVHGDVTPNNILLGTAESSAFESNTGDVLHATLIDFGLARRSDPSSATAKLQVALGTPRYVSPEQIRGETVTPRSDMYSLGIILFEALTKHYPFPELADGAPDAAFCAAHLGGCEKVPLETYGAFPKRLCALVDSAIERDPAKRPATALVFAAELAQVLEELKPAKATTGREHTTVRRVLSVFDREGRDDSVPASQQTKTVEAPPPSHMSSGSTHESELVVADDINETRDLELSRDMGAPGPASLPPPGAALEPDPPLPLGSPPVVVGEPIVLELEDSRVSSNPGTRRPSNENDTVPGGAPLFEHEAPVPPAPALEGAPEAKEPIRASAAVAPAAALEPSIQGAAQWVSPQPPSVPVIPARTISSVSASPPGPPGEASIGRPPRETLRGIQRPGPSAPANERSGEAERPSDKVFVDLDGIMGSNGGAASADELRELLEGLSVARRDRASDRTPRAVELAEEPPVRGGSSRRRSSLLALAAASGFVVALAALAVFWGFGGTETGGTGGVARTAPSNAAAVRAPPALAAPAIAPSRTDFIPPPEPVPIAPASNEGVDSGAPAADAQHHSTHPQPSRAPARRVDPSPRPRSSSVSPPNDTLDPLWEVRTPSSDSSAKR